LGKSGSIFAVKATKLLAMSLLVVGSLVLAGIGSTFATWSDSETSEGNYIETGSVDLLVAKCGADWQNPAPFKDDIPHGVGLDSCFAATLAPGNYTCWSLLWNAGCINADAYLHIDNVSDSNALSSYTIMSIWYDDDGKPGTSLEMVASGTIADLNCHEIRLGGLPAGAVRQLKLEVEYIGPCPTHGLSFDIIFQLAGDGFADSEISQNYFSVPT
jgi:predicted ribosomally synthesized peptide with SipW-like signal peptide